MVWGLTMEVRGRLDVGNQRRRNWNNCNSIKNKNIFYKKTKTNTIGHLVQDLSIGPDEILLQTLVSMHKGPL